MYIWEEILNADRSVTPAWMGWKLDMEFGIQFMPVLVVAPHLPIGFI